MLATITVFTAMVCVMLTGAVLVQNPKGGGIDSTFGGNASTKVLGASKTNSFVERLTWTLGVALFVLCLVASLIVG